jgi:hypothetical protein
MYEQNKAFFDTVSQPISKRRTSIQSASKNEMTIQKNSNYNEMASKSKSGNDTVTRPISKQSTSIETVSKSKFGFEMLPSFIYHYKTLDETVLKQSVHSYSTKMKLFYSNTFSCGGFNWVVKHMCVQDTVSLFIKCQNIKEMPNDTVIRVSYVFGISNTENESNAIIKQCSGTPVIFTYEQDTIGFKTFCKSGSLNSNNGGKSRPIVEDDCVDLICIIRVHENTLTLKL